MASTAKPEYAIQAHAQQGGHALELAPSPVQLSETAAIFSMIERASRDPAVDIDKLERLMQMSERVTARNAKSAYFAALSEMQEHLPVIGERGEIKIGSGKPQTYALWEDINEAIKPALSSYGFALSFRTGREADRIVVTGILSHREGHTEETTMHLPLDASGSKNAVQAVGSSTSYGKRYTAGALLNLTSRAREDRDDDGAAGGGASISDVQMDELRALIDETKTDIRRFCAHFKIDAVADLRAVDYARAVSQLNAKRKVP